MATKKRRKSPTKHKHRTPGRDAKGRFKKRR